VDMHLISDAAFTGFARLSVYGHLVDLHLISRLSIYCWFFAVHIANSQFCDGRGRKKAV
jgi:hypothetical protein